MLLCKAALLLLSLLTAWPGVTKWAMASAAADNATGAAAGFNAGAVARAAAIVVAAITEICGVLSATIL